MAYVALNFGTSTIASGINASDTTINVQTGHGVRFAVGSNYSYLVLENTGGNTEIVKITGQTGDALTVVRAQDGTTARSWLTGDAIESRPCAAAIADILAEATTAGTSAVSSHLSDTTAAHAASAISYAGSAGLAATDVEGALDELDSEKASLSGAAFSGLVSLNDGADIASAATVNLTAATGNTVRITGTVATSALTMNAGQEMILVPTGAWPLTHHATNLNLSGGANYTCAVGDRLYCSKDNAGVVRVSIFKQDGTAVVSPTIPQASAQVFTSSGTFTVPAGVTSVRVTVIGGGAAGGGGSGSPPCYSGGGGAGGYAYGVVSGLTPGGTVTVTVGAGGVGSGTGAGGTSSFGSYITATGGAFPGNHWNTAGAFSGGAGGTATGGLSNRTGESGASGTNSVSSGQGGASWNNFGLGQVAAAGLTAAGTGITAVRHGGGGGGSIGDTNGYYGGSGAAGLVVVEW